MNRVEFLVERNFFHFSMEGFVQGVRPHAAQLAFAEEDDGTFGNGDRSLRAEVDRDSIGMLNFWQGPMAGSTEFSMGAIANGVFGLVRTYMHGLMRVNQLRLSSQFIYDVSLINNACENEMIDVVADVGFVHSRVPTRGDPAYSSTDSGIGVDALQLAKIPASTIPDAALTDSGIGTYHIPMDGQPHLIGQVRVDFFSWALKLAVIPPTPTLLRPVVAVLQRPFAGLDVNLEAFCSSAPVFSSLEQPNATSGDR